MADTIRASRRRGVKRQRYHSFHDSLGPPTAALDYPVTLGHLGGEPNVFHSPRTLERGKDAPIRRKSLMFSKKLALVALFVLMVPMLAACGPETPAVQPTATTAAATAVVEPTATTASTEATPTTAVSATSATTTTNQTATNTETMYAAVDCEYGGLMKSIEAVDDTTVKFTMCAPDPAFPSKIAFASVGIQSAAHLQATGGKPLEKAVGSGPYMVKEWVRGDHLTLEANPNYWGEAAKTKTVIFRWNSEAAARLTSLKAGEAQGIDNAKPPLDNEKVRQAIAMGINRQAIVDKFYPGGSSVASHFTPCGIPGGCEGEAWYNHDLEAAKAMLADSGATNINLKIAYRDVVRGYLPTPGKVAEELQAQLKELGINATIDVQESGTFLDNASK